jgi:hypothetical protein
MLAMDNPRIEIPNQPADTFGQDASYSPAEAALLITCLRGLPFDLPDDTDWKTLLTLAEENGVLLLAYATLLASGADMPAFFKEAAQECRAAAETLAAALAALLEDFAEHGIEALPLKGPDMAAALYGDAALRQSNDIDLLVRRDNFSKAEALLLRRGFASLGAASEHDRRFLRSELLVELHFELASPRFFPFHIDDIWSRSHCIHFRGKPARAMADSDLALYLCAHGLKHGFSRLIWILDLCRALQGWEPHEYEELMRKAKRGGLQTWLLIGCEVVRAMFPQQLPEALDAAIAISPVALKRARRAAERLFLVDQQVVVNDYRGFYLQAEPDPLKRWRYRLRYLAPTEADYRWARGHRIHPALMILLRPFRLLEKFGISRMWHILFPSKGLEF